MFLCPGIIESYTNNENISPLKMHSPPSPPENLAAGLVSTYGW